MSAELWGADELQRIAFFENRTFEAFDMGDDGEGSIEGDDAATAVNTEIGPESSDLNSLTHSLPCDELPSTARPNAIADSTGCSDEEAVT